MECESETMRGLLSGLDRMGLRVVTRCETENCIFSPLSATLMCGCCAYLLEGDNLSRLFEWLGVDASVSDSDFADCVKWLGDHFRQHENSSMHWELFVPEHTSLPDRYVAFVEGRMGVGTRRTTFPSPGVDLINKAVAKATHNRIENLLNAGCVSPDSLALINAVYFDGYWEREFRLSRTDDWKLPDSSHRVSLVGAKSTFKYSGTSKYHYLAIPYKRSKEMEIFMSKDRSRLPVDLSVDDMCELRSKARPENMTLFIPQWEQPACDTSIGELLSEAGVDLSDSIASRVMMMQNARIIVNKHHTEVAAVTTLWGCECVEDRPLFHLFPFKVDQPFVYTIRSGPVTEFIGYYYDDPNAGDYGYDDERWCEVA